MKTVMAIQDINKLHLTVANQIRNMPILKSSSSNSKTLGASNCSLSLHQPFPSVFFFFFIRCSQRRDNT